jgi:capsular polysaccharide transport system permease protein
MTTESKTTLRRGWGPILWIGVPTLCVLIYLSFIAAPTYQSQTKLIVQENQDSPGAMFPGVTSGLLGNVAQSALKDSYILVDYLHSSELIEALDAELDLKVHYASPSSDVFRRLKKNPAKETFYDYFREQTRMQVSPDSGIITLETRAFSPELSKAIAEMMIVKSEGAINRINQRVLNSTTKLAERQLSEQREHLTTIRKKLLNFQIDNQFVNSENSVGAQVANLAQLDARLLNLNATLKTKGQFLREDAFELKSVRQEIKGLSAQRDEEAARLFTLNNSGIALAAHEYEALKLESEFILTSFTSALVASEQAKLEALKQGKFLLTIAKPYLPEKAKFPDSFTGTLTAFFIIALGFGIIRLIVATIKDHNV